MQASELLTSGAAYEDFLVAQRAYHKEAADTIFAELESAGFEIVYSVKDKYPIALNGFAILNGNGYRIQIQPHLERVAFTRYELYLNEQREVVYALDTESGQQYWKNTTIAKFLFSQNKFFTKPIRLTHTIEEVHAIIENWNKPVVDTTLDD